MTPDQLQALARETAEELARTIVYHEDDIPKEAQAIILSALEKATAEANKKAEALATALDGIDKHVIEVFHDGVGADLHDAGITTLEDAFMEGMSEASRELKEKARAALAAYRKEKQL